MYALATISEIADGLGVSARAVRARAKKGQWRVHSHKGRKWRAFYLITDLPADVQAALSQEVTRKIALRMELERRAGQVAREASLARYMSLSIEEKARIDARTEVLRALKAFAETKGIKIAQARRAFAISYNASLIDVADRTRGIVRHVSPRTLSRWEKTAATAGLSSLSSCYGNRKGAGRIDCDPEVKRVVVKMLVDAPHAGAAAIIQALRARFETERLPSYRSLQRWLGEWKRDNAQVLTAIRDPDAWRSKYQAAAGSASADVVRLNQRWELDSTPADVMLKDPSANSGQARHVVVGAIDVYSRRAKLIIAPTSRATAVAALLRRCLLEWGVPEEVVTDNGKDYTSNHVGRILDGLGIDHRLARPFTPEAKPHIERFFRTFAHDLVELCAGFIGHNVAERKAIEARRSFAQRFGKRGEDVAVGMTAAEFQDFADAWCEDLYGRRPHRGLGGRSPFEMAAAWADPVRSVEDERALDVLLAEAPEGGVRTVQKKGLRIDGATYVHAELGPVIGERVHVRYDPADLGRIYVFRGADGAYLCTAECPELIGIDRRQAAAKMRKRQRAAIRERRAALKREARGVRTGDVVAEILAERAEEARRLAAFPQPCLVHETPALEAAGEAARGKPETRVATPVEPSQADRALAAQAIASYKPREAPARAPRADGRPWFDDDRSWAEWVLANPGKATAIDFEELQKWLALPSARLLLGLDGQGKEGALRLCRERLKAQTQGGDDEERLRDHG